MNKLMNSLINKPYNIHFSISILLSSIIVILAISSVGCSTDSNITRSPAIPKTPEQHVELAHRKLEQANNTRYPHSLEYRLLASEHFIQGGDYNEANNTLKDILNQEPDIDTDARRLIFEARHALVNKETKRADSLVKLMKNSVARLTQAQPLTYKEAKEELKIGLLLPSRGRYAKEALHIKDGFLKAYHQENSNNQADGNIEIYDTSENGGALAAYQRALEDNVNVIIGPLTKTEVELLANENLPIPVLALNTIKKNTQSKPLYQFGLMPEDEVIAVAFHAIQQGHSRALVIAAENPWGNRMMRAFRIAFEKNQGQIVSTISLSPNQDYSHKLKTTLTQIKSDPSKEFDMIFLAASPDFGRSLKPFIQAHQLHDVPIYATAAIYTGVPAPHLDQDLNGIRFCDMPGVLNNQNYQGEHSTKQKQPSKKQIAELSIAPRYFALGNDAYYLSRKLSKLSSTQTIKDISGLTGILKMDDKHHIQRRLVCAKFENGIPIPD